MINTVWLYLEAVVVTRYPQSESMWLQPNMAGA